MKYHRGINQCHIASDKIIEVRSNGRKVRSSGMKVRSNGRKVRSSGMKVRSNGMKVRSNGRKVRSSGMKVRLNGMEVPSNGRKVRSNGTRIRSNGMQVTIRLHFCAECPSIQITCCCLENTKSLFVAIMTSAKCMVTSMSQLILVRNTLS